MKTVKILAALVLLPIAISSCDFQLNKIDGPGQGSITVHFNKNSVPVPSKSGPALPDTNDFILKIARSDGHPVYEGSFGAAPESILTAPGSYTVSVLSRHFDEPLFDCPQFGDEQVVMVNPGENVCAIMDCYQLNAGLRLVIAPGFRTSYPRSILYLNSADGKLMYGYSEKRTAYFKPGIVNLTLAGDGREELLLTRTLEARQMLTLNLFSAEYADEAKGLFLQIDTARIWTQDSFIAGDSDIGGGSSEAYSVNEAKYHAGEKEAWVYGYIVGVSTSTSKSEFNPPFSSNTNLVIASRSTVTDRSVCFSVELSKGDIRDALNLKDNPSNLGRQVFLKGDIVESYYGLAGLKSVKEYRWGY